MEIAFILLALVGTVILFAQLAERINFPAPIMLLLVGILASAAPFIPDVPLSPEIALYGLLPPLLYAAAQGTSIAAIKNYRQAIIGLSVGLVLFTTFGVAAVASLVLPIPFAIAVALGAIVAPPDAVAATAVARRIGLPRSITTILEGESLFNNATALVTLRTAVAAAGFLVTGEAHGEVTWASAALDFGWAVVGGVGIGIAVAFVVGFVRRRLTRAAADTALSWSVPFLAYLPAEEVHASGVFAVVTAGLLLAHKAPMVQSAASRMSERANWASITYLMENVVFLLIGLQLTSIVRDVEADSLSLTQTVLAGLAVLGAVIVLRPIWMFPFTMWAARRSGWGRRQSAWTFVAAWAGMRGVVTLAAAMTLPAAVPHRPVLIMVALIVTLGTLLIQGLSLPRVARWLDVRGPDPRADALQVATVAQSVVGAGLRHTEETPDVDQETIDTLRSQAEQRLNRVWERVNSQASGGTTPSDLLRTARLGALGAERSELMRIRSEGSVDEPVIARVLAVIDAEEASLRFAENSRQAELERPLKAPDQVTVNCEHLLTEPLAHTPTTADGCQECLELGRTTWVALRMCTHCGNIGCCDSSLGHATVHFQETGHPVMRSAEPGEFWRWCYVDEVLG